MSRISTAPTVTGTVGVLFPIRELPDPKHANSYRMAQRGEKSAQTTRDERGSKFWEEDNHIARGGGGLTVLGETPTTGGGGRSEFIGIMGQRKPNTARGQDLRQMQVLMLQGDSQMP